ncbi:VacJ family lipoprotein [Bermanella marisrubri]|uniref:VacJ lipoprotein n=1 Tax=Bermanella marisrubri TaxID=207949 RepID=Q1N0N7_9GAMM|nr:VacJ family lipoprotein [Bermanella marisrubri]EAT11796.1 vacJ lipoprotein [Oceanobacter sp. RED65] [Bermanella marisrubri]QIZ83831.1 VacJ family lipoprotein [Bermanella marisrubri]
MKYLALFFFCCLPLVGIAQEDDPWEEWNRKVFAFNETMDKYAARPVAQAYRNAAPQFVDDAISNVFNNLGEPVVIVSDLAQGKFLQALSDTGRFLVNSTVGILGIFDVAKYIGLEKHDEDIGQVLGYWGVSSGPYLVLPLLGPSTVRDTAGFSVEVFTLDTLDPQVQLLEENRVYWGSVYSEYVDIRADLMVAEGILSGDKYSFMRSIYLQRREYLVTDGEKANDFDDGFDKGFEEEYDF